MDCSQNLSLSGSQYSLLFVNTEEFKCFHCSFLNSKHMRATRMKRSCEVSFLKTNLFNFSFLKWTAARNLSLSGSHCL